VELAVPGTGESLTYDITGGHFDGGGAGVGGERGRGAKAVHVADASQDFPGGQLADPAQFSQRAPAGLDSPGDLGARNSDTPVEVADFGDELGSQPTQGSRSDAAGSHGAQQPGRGVGTELAWRPAGQPPALSDHG
jgi:hypothetical protein